MQVLAHILTYDSPDSPDNILMITPTGTTVAGLMRASWVTLIILISLITL